MSATPIDNATPAEQLAWDDQRLHDPHGQPDKATRVRQMFDGIAPTYERVNRIASAGRDAHWRRRAVKLASVRPNDRVLDLACGTGDLAREFAAAGPSRVVGADFAANMLRLAARRGSPRTTWCQADALYLPFADGSFDIVSCAFGVRNFQSLPAGLAEMRRVLAPGGRAVIVEFGMPTGTLTNRAYRFYFNKVLPRLATWISRDRSGAYRYLPQSVQTFVDRAGMLHALHAAGFASAAATSMTFGVCLVYVGTVGAGSTG